MVAPAACGGRGLKPTAYAPESPNRPVAPAACGGRGLKQTITPSCACLLVLRPPRAAGED